MEPKSIANSQEGNVYLLHNCINELLHVHVHKEILCNINIKFVSFEKLHS